MLYRIDRKISSELLKTYLKVTWWCFCRKTFFLFCLNRRTDTERLTGPIKSTEVYYWLKLWNAVFIECISVLSNVPVSDSHITLESGNTLHIFFKTWNETAILWLPLQCLTYKWQARNKPLTTSFKQQSFLLKSNNLFWGCFCKSLFSIVRLYNHNTNAKEHGL